jgi:hypothetical protein
MIELANLTFYPIKACRGFNVSEANIERMGLENDRRMMLVTPAGDFLTQREYPRLAWVTPVLSDGSITLTAPDFESLNVTIQTDGPVWPVNIWKSAGVHAIDQGDTAAEWFSKWLGVPARLVHLKKGYQRRLNPAHAVNTDDHTGFADGYPILLISEESLQDLNSRLESPIPMNRFRPNLVVRGCDPYAEDSWKRIRIGRVEMAIVKPCPRCVVTTIEQETLVPGKEPLKTLNTYRKREGGVMFGQNGIPLNFGRLELGMRVEVLS